MSLIAYSHTLFIFESVPTDFLTKFLLADYRE